MMRAASGIACFLLTTVGTWASSEPPDSDKVDVDTQAPKARATLPDRPIIPPDYPVIPKEPEPSLLEQAMEAAKEADAQTEICCLPSDDCVFVAPGNCKIPPVNYGD